MLSIGVENGGGVRREFLLGAVFQSPCALARTKSSSEVNVMKKVSVLAENLAELLCLVLRKAHV